MHLRRPRPFGRSVGRHDVYGVGQVSLRIVNPDQAIASDVFLGWDGIRKSATIPSKQPDWGAFPGKKPYPEPKTV